MKTHLVVNILLALFLCMPLYSQCNNTLVEIAMAQSGRDADFVREFKVKLQGGTVKNPIPTGKFNVYLKEKTTYRFNIASDKNTGNEAVLQLFSNGMLVGNTYNEAKNENLKRFDYTAAKTGSFQVVICFLDGKPGCAAGVMSMVQTDTLPSLKNEELETLYLNVENPVSIVTDKELNDSIIFLIDNGQIFEKAGSFVIRPASEGLATLRVVIKSDKGVVKEEAHSDFLVKRMPFPVGNIQGMKGGIISRSSLQIAEGLSIDNPVDFEKYGYEIVDYVVRAGDRGESRMFNAGRKFNPSLKNFIENIPEGMRIVIESIRVRTPGGQVTTLEPIGFIVR